MNIEQLNDSIQERLDTRGSHNTSPPDSSSSEQESNEVSSETQELLEISCEFDYHEYLLEKLRDHGWNVHRHVQPDNSNYEVDLLINHPKYDSEWIGIEAKFIDSDPAGITLGDAHIQITEKYWDKEYFGDTVDLWAVAPFHNVSSDDLEYASHAISVNRTIQQLLSRYGIGYLYCGYNFAKIDFNYCKGSHKIPVFAPSGDIPTYNQNNTDIDDIRRLVNKKRSNIESY